MSAHHATVLQSSQRPTLAKPCLADSKGTGLLMQSMRGCMHSGLLSALCKHVQCSLICPSVAYAIVLGKHESLRSGQPSEPRSADWSASVMADSAWVHHHTSFALDTL